MHLLQIFVPFVIAVGVHMADPPPPPICQWGSEITNTNSPNGLSISNKTSIAECKDFCISVGWCYAIDWNEAGDNTGVKCFLSTSNITIFQSGSGIKHYIYTCTLTTTATATLTPGPNTSPGCFWNATANANSPNGIAQSSPISVQECQSLCQATPWCQGLDWNDALPSGQKCYLTNSVIVNSGVNGVTHYQLKCNIGPPSTLAAGTKSCWSAQSGTTESNIFQPFPDLLSCQNGCNQLPGICSGVDWNTKATNGQQCYFSISSIVVPNDKGYLHYTYSATTCKGFRFTSLALGFLLLATFLFHTIIR